MDYESKFWDLYDEDPDAAEKLEDIMNDLGIEFEEDDEGNLSLKFEDEYEQIINEYENRGNSTEDFISRLVNCLSNEFSDVRTFEDAGVLTMNDGVVIYDGGKEYQLSWLGSYRH